MRKLIAVAVLALSLSACYHATVQTGLTPSAVQVERAWAHGWLFGLVPPSITNVAADCPRGVARVETQVSFVNQLASFLTSGLYTPMMIEVTCAQ